MGGGHGVRRLIGTPTYMALEQPVDARADIHAAGPGLNRAETGPAGGNIVAGKTASAVGAFELGQQTSTRHRVP